MKNIKIIPTLFFLCICLLHTSLHNYNEDIAAEKSADNSAHEESFDEIIFNWSRTFAQVMDLAHKKHYKINDIKESMVKAIDGFASTLDAHSGLLDTKTYKDMLEMTSGEFYGIGVVIDNMRKKKDKHLTIVDTIPDGPADKAGILPMDKIVEVNNEILEGMPTEKVIALIKGERNSTVNIKILRENNPDLLSFDVIRDVVKEQHSLSFRIKNYNVSYLSLSMFTDLAVKQIATLLQKSQENNDKGLILDLRNNSGGLLTAVIDIAGLFLKKNSLVTITKDKNNQETDRYSTKREPIANQKLPIFVLINNFTASAAEILAGALKIHSDKNNNNLVFLVGTKTFGKGSVQEVIPISNSCALKITTHLYFLPDNTTIQGTGIEPDFLVERTTPPTEQVLWFTKHYGREESLDNYIKIAKTEQKTMDSEKKSDTKKKSSRRTDRALEMLQKDNQLRDCIILINMLHTAQTYTPQLIDTRATALEYLKHNYVSSETLDIEEIKI
jgi:carboxyl-terminal processing protease